MYKMHILLVLGMFSSLFAAEGGGVLLGLSPDAVTTSPNNVGQNAGTTDTFRQSLSLKAQLKKMYNSLSSKMQKLSTDPVKVATKLKGTRDESHGGSVTHRLAEKLNEEGAINIGGESQTRIYLEPFFNMAKTKKIKDSTAMSDKNLGVLLGTQFASFENCVFGVYGGMSEGSAHATPERRNKLTQTYHFLSAYHWQSFKNGFRYDLLAQRKPYTQRIDRLTTTNQIAKGKRKADVWHLNIEGSYRIPLNDRLSVRPSLGLSTSDETDKAYDETEGGAENLHYDRSKTKSREVYVGIGIRDQKEERCATDRHVYKLTALYEIGHELAYRGQRITQTVINTGRSSIGKIPSTGNIAHYLTFYGSIQYNDLKFLGNYVYTIKRYKQKHLFSLKTEWRF
jgi:hypothetical protein